MLSLKDLLRSCILEMEIQDDATHVLLSNMYATARRWENVTAIRQSMKKKGMEKVPGLSRMENTSHPDKRSVFCR